MRFFIKPIIIISIIVIYSCKPHTKDTSFITINGIITKGTGEKILLQLLTPNEIVNIDSLILTKDGKFTFKYLPNEKSIFILRKENNIITFIGDKGDVINIETDYENFEKEYKISGNNESELLNNLNVEVQNNLKTLDSIGKIWKDAMYASDRQKIKIQLDSIYFKTFSKQKEFQRKLIEQNSGTFAAMLCLYIPFGREAVFNEKEDFKLFAKVKDSLVIKYPDNSHVKNFARKIHQKEMLRLENELSLKRNKNQ